MSGRLQNRDYFMQLRPAMKVPYQANPEATYQENLAGKLADIDAKELQQEQLKNKLVNLPQESFSQTLRTMIDQGLSIEEIEKLFKANKNLTDSPMVASQIIKTILEPSMMKYVKENPAKQVPLNYIYGTAMKLVPDSLRPAKNVFEKRKKTLKSVIAKGLLGQSGNLTELEQQDPLEFLPTDYDDPTAREEALKTFTDLLNAYGGGVR